MIYTITLNPSIDYVVHINELQQGEVNRATSSMYYPGGKGINVSRVLKRLGKESTALGFVAGFTGDFIKEKLQSENVHEKFISVEGISRINVKLKAENETEVNGTGPQVNDEHIAQLLVQLNCLTESDIVVLAGSIPNTIRSDIYEKILTTCQKVNAKVIVDTGGETLKSLIAYKPFLIKPNHHELGDLFNVKIDSIEEAITYARKLLNDGVQNIIVSMAGEGAVLVTNEGTYKATAPKGKVKNSVGAGDSLVAGFLAGLHEYRQLVRALQYGIASGSATAFSDDLCEKIDVEMLLPNVVVNEIDGGKI